MDRYSLEWCNIYLDELTDKMGSDLFPISIKLNRFITLTLDFIREQTKLLEVTQEISDDVKSLLVNSNFDVIQDPVNTNLWTCAEPLDYYRLVSLVPLFVDPIDGHLKQKAKTIKIFREGERIPNQRDPFNTSTDEYPQVYRFSNLFQFNVGQNSNTTYTKAYITYIKKPTFADLTQLDTRIVNLNDFAIEQILLKTADALRFSTGDEDAMPNYQFGQTFGKRKG